MKKVLFIMAAALMTMTQCRKQETMPVTPATDTIKMTVTAGSGRTDINTETGSITWSAGDKLYVSDGTSWLGSLTLQSGAGTPQGTFTGSVTGLDDEGTPCHFFYLGKDNIATTPTGTAAANISLAEQDGTLPGAMKYHIGYGNTNVTLTKGEYAGYVLMNTKIAFAHINFTTDGTQAYTGSVTMGGTGVSNTLSVNPNGTFSGSGDGGIQIGGTSGMRYVTLIPTETTDVLNVAFTGDATGSMTFANGIEANKFYGMKDAMAVTLTPKPKFSVGENTTVEFSPGNLYWDGSAFRFEANQWSFESSWNTNHVSLFFWCKDAAEAIKSDFNWNTQYDDVFFTNATHTTANPDFHVNGETGTNQWRTLSSDEWYHLLFNRANASSLRVWKDLGNNVKGLVILPDGTENPSTVMNSISSTSDLATYGAVFLQASGYRYGTGVQNVGNCGYYWSSAPVISMMFDMLNALKMQNDDRNCGEAVRLVR